MKRPRAMRGACDAVHLSQTPVALLNMNKKALPSAPEWGQVKSVFAQAMGLPLPERNAFVRQQGLGQATQDEVLHLLSHTTDAMGGSGSLEQGAPWALAAEPGSRQGQLLGAWCLVSAIGSGGMGEVWLAKRSDGSYDGHAAVKLLKRGMDSTSVLRRFEAERQSLARLDHPHIARLLDAGLSRDGLPYFVMEHVQGQAIDAATQGMALHAKLAVFLQLADAVSYAHRNLLVHRDLKPGNVLLSTQGQVKLLDFGIAKALDTADSEQTRQGERPFTPSFASPEQVRGEPLSTATDVYSLGVLLYAVLTGQRPYARQTTDAHAVAQAVLNEAPTKPSELSAREAGVLNWEQTRKKIKGDLDNILLKSLEKNALDRYASVDAFAADITAFLEGRPVSAREPSFAYVASKFVARHKLSVALAGAVFVSIIGGGVAVAWQAKLAHEQRLIAERRFDDVYEFARATLFDVDVALKDGATAGREKLVSTAAKYLDKLAADERLASTKPELWRDIAEAYERIGDIQGGQQASNLGRPDDASKSYERAFAIRQRLAQQAPGDLKNLRGLASAHDRMGDQLRASDQLQAALPHYEASTRIAEQIAQRLPDDLQAQINHTQATRYLSSIHFRPFFASLGNYPKGKALLESTVPVSLALLARFGNQGVALENMNAVYNQLSDLRRMEGRYADMLDITTKNEAIAQALHALDKQNPRNHRFLALSVGRRGDALFDTGDFAQGKQVWQSSIAMHEAVAQSDAANERAQRNVANAYGGLGEHLYLVGEFEQARGWLQKEFELLTRLRAKHPQVKFLVGRWVESARDYAALLSNTRASKEALRVQALLDAEQAASLRKATDSPELAKLHTQRASTLLRADPTGDHSVTVAQAEGALAFLDQDAKRQPYSATARREFAIAAHRLGDAAVKRHPQRACMWLAQSAKALAELASDNIQTPALGAMTTRNQGAVAAQCGAK